MKLFNALCQARNLKSLRLLDIGGHSEFWEINIPAVEKGLIESVDIVNLTPSDQHVGKIDETTLHIYTGNALKKETLRLPSYDLVFSNSVIEHVGSLRDQQTMANIILSIAPYHFIQTPAKCFPLEPHFNVPFFQFFPLWIRTLLHQKMNLGHERRSPQWLQARIEVESTRLLTKREYSALFPHDSILTERVFGFAKSYMATNLA